MAEKNRWTKDPDENLDYKFDWAAETNGTGDEDWLESGDTISTFTVGVPSGLTEGVSNKADGDTSVVVWISGGTDGTDYEISCEIVTADGRTGKRTKTLRVRSR